MKLCSDSLDSHDLTGSNNALALIFPVVLRRCRGKNTGHLGRGKLYLKSESVVWWLGYGKRGESTSKPQLAPGPRIMRSCPIPVASRLGDNEAFLQVELPSSS